MFLGELTPFCTVTEAGHGMPHGRHGYPCVGWIRNFPYLAFLYNLQGYTEQDLMSLAHAFWEEDD